MRIFGPEDIRRGKEERDGAETVWQGTVWLKFVITKMLFQPSVKDILACQYINPSQPQPSNENANVALRFTSSYHPENIASSSFLRQLPEHLFENRLTVVQVNEPQPLIIQMRIIARLTARQMCRWGTKLFF